VSPVRHRLFALALLAAHVVRAQGSASHTPSGSPSVHTRDPQPEDATHAILAAFSTFSIVAIGDYHTSQDIQNFVLTLVRHPAFPNVVNDIVVEGTNGSLQPLLDRYIAGDDVQMADARRLWRDGMNPAGINDVQAQLFPLVRRINQQLPPAKRLRVVAGEDGIDWATVTPAMNTEYLSHREEHIAAVLEREVLTKHRKALMFYGGAHVWHGSRGDAGPGYQNAMGIFEAKHPGVTFVVFPYMGGRQRTRCSPRASTEAAALETKMVSWPVPSLARTKGTWLEDFAKSDAWNPLQTMVAARLGKTLIDSTATAVDAYLYLGPPDLLLAKQPLAFTFVDTNYLTELHRRQIAVGAGTNDPRTVPEQVSQHEGDALLCAARQSR
jgi:hypothetical protein